MIPRTHEEIEEQVRRIQSKKKELNTEVKEQVGLGKSGYFDKDIYCNEVKFEKYSKSIAVNSDIDEDDDISPFPQKKRNVYTAPAAILKEIAGTETGCDPFANTRRKTVAEKEDDYRQRHRCIVISPERIDPFADGGKTPLVGARTYKEVMQEQLLKREEKELRSKLISKAKERTLNPVICSEDKTIREKKESVKREVIYGSMNKKNYKRSRSSSNSSHYTDSDDDSLRQKSQKTMKSLEDRHHRRKHHRNHKSRNENSGSEGDGRHKHRDQDKNDRQKDNRLFGGAVKVKEEPLSEDERGRKLKTRITEDTTRRSDSRDSREGYKKKNGITEDTTRRSDSRDSREGYKKKNGNSDSRQTNDRSRKSAKEKDQSDQEPEWGKKDIKTEKKDQPKNSAKPDFGLSGKLTEDANTYNGVVIKYSEPPEARKPKRRWRLYPFKGETALAVLHIHRQSAYLLGRDRKVADIPIDHPSCSKQHAALQYRLVPFTRVDGSKGRQIKLYVIDLESANGTYLNNQKIEAKKYYELKERDVVKFGYSSREYVLLHEHSKDSENDDDVNNDD